MRPIEIEELKDLSTYERVRSEVRRQIVELRARRRLRLGDRISVVFENRETILFRIQELLRVEKITEPTEILHEIDAINELLPKTEELTGMLFVEWHDPESIRRELEALDGLDRGEHLWIDLGPSGRVAARFSEGESREGRVAGVHHVRFSFAAEPLRCFRAAEHPASLVIEHRNCNAQTAIDGPIRQSLIQDLVGD